jgi:hypothetical protein
MRTLFRLSPFIGAVSLSHGTHSQKTRAPITWIGALITMRGSDLQPVPGHVTYGRLRRRCAVRIDTPDSSRVSSVESISRV